MLHERTGRPYEVERQNPTLSRWVNEGGAPGPARDLVDASDNDDADDPSLTSAETAHLRARERHSPDRTPRLTE
jgi:hypothetical protein